MTRLNKLTVLAAAVALSVGLSACGGGSSKTAIPEPTDEEKCTAAGGTYADGMCETAEAKALAAAKTAAQTAADMADTAADAAEMAANAQTANKAHDETSYALAKNAAERARAASDAAATANTAAQAATTAAAAEAQRDIAQREQKTAETERANAQKYAGMVSAAKTKADNDAAAAVVTKAAGTKLTAMNAEAGRAVDATDEGLGGHANDAAADTAYTLAISRDRDGTEVKVTDPANNNRADPKFVDQMAGLDAGRVMFVRTQDADADGNVEEEVVVVGTDIEAPRVVAFAKVMGQALNARDLDANVDADGNGTPTDDYTALTVDGTSAGVRALVKSASFPLTGDAELSFDFDVANTNADEADEVRGTYNGAMGTYRCNGTAACTVTVGADPSDATKRIITAMGDGWVFTPDAGVTSDVPDAEYLHYGFWLKKTTDADGVLTYNEVETFAGASFAASGSVAAVTGTASYEGDAVGVYVHHELSEGGGKIESSTSGHFKADASLMATFGQPAAPNNNIPPNTVNTITGTIDNFTLSGGEAQDWSVNLARSSVSDTGTHAGMVEGGGVSGSYSATFHGDVTAVDGTVPKPSAVVGEFNANMSNGSVAGAFGANIE